MDLNEFFKNFRSSTPFYSYDPQLFDKPQSQIDLEEKIKSAEIRMRELTNQLKFEEAIVLRDEIKELKSELEELIAVQQSEQEKNKSSKEIMKTLQSKLDDAVRTEDFETAAQIRDQIKQSFEKTEKTK